MDKEKEEMKESINEIIFLSDFICYNSLEKNQKKIKKKLKKLLNHIENDEFSQCMSEEWLQKYDE
jgi:Txe/YoeB family toxin of Txe-Axe toxin-antitoxin module